MREPVDFWPAVLVLGTRSAKAEPVKQHTNPKASRTLKIRLFMPATFVCE
jgi:hypothetical protein